MQQGSLRANNGVLAAGWCPATPLKSTRAPNVLCWTSQTLWQPRLRKANLGTVAASSPRAALLQQRLVFTSATAPRPAGDKRHPAGDCPRLSPFRTDHPTHNSSVGPRAAQVDTLDTCERDTPHIQTPTAYRLEGRRVTLLGWCQHQWESLKNAFTTPYDQAILALAAPAVLALAADPLLGIIDTAFVGRLGQDELAALGVNNSLFASAFVIFNFLSIATTPLIATALGANDTEQVGQVVVQASAMSLLLGFGLAAGLMSNSDAALSMMGVDAASQSHLHQIALDFLLIRAAAAPAVLLMTVGQGVFRGVRDMTTPLQITLATNAVHLVLDPLLMFQLHMGMRGAAISTTASEWIAALAYVSAMWNRRTMLGLWPLPQMDAATFANRCQPFLQAGSAVLMRTALLLGTRTLASATATRLGPASIASHQVLMQLWVLFSLVIDSLAVAGQTLVAVDLGKGDRAEARHVSNRLLQMGLGLGSGLALLLAMAAPMWPSLFTSDPDVVEQLGLLMPLALALLPANALVYVLDGVLVGAQDFAFLVPAMGLAAATTVAVLAAVEPMGLGLKGVWMGMAVLMLGRLATLAYRYQSPSGPVPPLASGWGAMALPGPAMAPPHASAPAPSQRSHPTGPGLAKPGDQQEGSSHSDEVTTAAGNNGSSRESVPPAGDASFHLTTAGALVSVHAVEDAVMRFQPAQSSGSGAIDAPGEPHLSASPVEVVHLLCASQEAAGDAALVIAVPVPTCAVVVVEPLGEGRALGATPPGGGLKL